MRILASAYPSHTLALVESFYSSGSPVFGGGHVVGLLLAVLYDPVWTSAILSSSDFGLAIGAYTLLVFWKVAPWLVVILTAVGGWLLVALPAML